MNYLRLAEMLLKVPKIRKFFSKEALLGASRFEISNPRYATREELSEFAGIETLVNPFNHCAVTFGGDDKPRILWISGEWLGATDLLYVHYHDGAWVAYLEPRKVGERADRHLYEESVYLLEDGSWSEIPNASKGLKVFPNTIWMRLLHDCNYPGNHVVRVREKNPHPSKVKWVISREHYLVIDRKSEGRNVLDASRHWPEEIRRAAHRRRAHMRLLSSPKWRNKVGTRVPVRAAWVGPKEWEGSDRKVYKVIT